jgi:hypothetical protein
LHPFRVHVAGLRDVLFKFIVPVQLAKAGYLFDLVMRVAYQVLVPYLVVPVRTKGAGLPSAESFSSAPVARKKAFSTVDAKQSLFHAIVRNQ